MGFKITFIVLCLLVTYCLAEAGDYKNRRHKKKYEDKHRGHNTFKHQNRNQETSVTREDRLKLAILTENHKATDRQASNENEVAESGGFNLDFNKIPGGAGIKMIYDALKNIFMAVNRALNFGFIWDGISGLISIFNIKTGATFVINAITKMCGFAGYMLTDVKNFINAIATGGMNITISALSLMQATANFAFATSVNLGVNALDLVNALMGLSMQNFEDILGPVHKLVSAHFKPLFDAIGNLVNSVGNGLMVFLEPMLGAIHSVTTPIVNVLAAILRTGGGIFDNGLFKAISTGLNGVLQNVVGGVVGGIKRVTGDFFSALAGALNAVGSVFQNVGAAIGSVLGRNNDGGGEMNTKGYTNINTTTIIGEEPIHLTYANNSDECFQHFIREGHNKADVVILYKGAEDNFLAFFNRIIGAVFIISGNKGHIGIFDIYNGGGIYLKPNTTKGYAIEPPGFLRADFVGPNAKNVSDALTRLANAIDKLSEELDTTADTVTLDVVEVLRTLTLKNLISSILSGEALTVVSRLLGNLLNNLAKGLPPIIRPALGVVNTLLPFVLNLPDNLVNSIISLIGNVVKRFLGIFTPDFLAELAKTVVIAALKGFTTPMLAPLLTPIGTISTAVSAVLLSANTAADLLNLPE